MNLFRGEFRVSERRKNRILPHRPKYKLAIQLEEMNPAGQQLARKGPGSQWIVVDLKLLAPLFATWP
jgi:hypothetical protein